MKHCTGVLPEVLAFTFAATTQETSKLTFKFQTLNVKGSQETDIYGIGNSGAVVGSYLDSSGVEHGLLLAGGKATNVDRAPPLAPSATTSTAAAPLWAIT